MSNYKVINIFIGTLLMSACTRATLDHPITPSSTAFTAESTDLPSLNSPIPTLSPPSDLSATVATRPTSTPNITSISTSTPVIRYQTLSVETDVPPEYEMDGSLVLDIIDEEVADYLLNLSNWEEYPLTTSLDSVVLLPEWTWPAVSPNGMWLAYFEQSNDPYQREMRVVSAYGQQQPILNWQVNWRGDILGWLDNERLLLTKSLNIDASLDIFDPNSGEWHVLVPTFPLTSSNGEIIGGMAGPGNPVLVYDRLQQLVIFERFLRDQNKLTFELWNVQSKEVLWERSFRGISSRPVWSPDDKSFAVIYLQYAESFDPTTDYGCLYLVSRDGHETKLTDKVGGELAWSPDGRYIATWWRGNIDFDLELPKIWGNLLAIVDISTKDVTIYSVGNASSAQHSIWSPDGSMIAIVSYREADEPVDDIATHVVIIDITRNRAFVVVKEAVVRGWMK